MAPQTYVPRRGDVVWITFNPQAGHEQAGRRLAVAVLPAAYNSRVGLAILCRITLGQNLERRLRKAATDPGYDADGWSAKSA